MFELSYSIEALKAGHARLCVLWENAWFTERGVCRYVTKKILKEREKLLRLQFYYRGQIWAVVIAGRIVI